MKQRGFTLLEVLVATVIMAFAVVGLLSNLSTSLQNAARLTDYERARLLARRTMDDLLTRPNLPKLTELQGSWDANRVGFAGGWRARVTPYQRAPNAAPGQYGLDRIQLQVWWMTGGRRHQFALDAYHAVVLRPSDLSLGAAVP